MQQLHARYMHDRGAKYRSRADGACRKQVPFPFLDTAGWCRQKRSLAVFCCSTREALIRE